MAWDGFDAIVVGAGPPWLFVGTPSGGRAGGGFLYANRESISLGVVVTLSALAAGSGATAQPLEDFTAQPAVELDDQVDDQVFRLLLRACPAGLYELGPAGHHLFDYAGCLECGTCRILGGAILRRWECPASSQGVHDRFG
jgi:ferredoxin-like protein FixX